MGLTMLHCRGKIGGKIIIRHRCCSNAGNGGKVNCGRYVPTKDPGRKAVVDDVALLVEGLGPELAHVAGTAAVPGQA
jgi:hypothetical protein